MYVRAISHVNPHAAFWQTTLSYTSSSHIKLFCFKNILLLSQQGDQVQVTYISLVYILQIKEKAHGINTLKPENFMTLFCPESSLPTYSQRGISMFSYLTCKIRLYEKCCSEKCHAAIIALFNPSNKKCSCLTVPWECSHLHIHLMLHILGIVIMFLNF